MKSDWAVLASYARSRYSQCGEEGVLERIFELIGTTNKVAVEFGCGDGYNLSNTRLLKEAGWTCHMWDSSYENEEIKRHLVTVENVNALFAHYEIPHEFDLLSLDIDGNDFWVWHALQWKPRVVLVEFNAGLPVGSKLTVTYDPDRMHDGSCYFGASFSLLVEEGAKKGYVPVCQLGNLNLFFVRRELVPEGEEPVVEHHLQFNHPPDPQGRAWVTPWWWEGCGPTPEPKDEP